MELIELVVFDVAGTTAKDDGLVVRAFREAMIEIGVQRDSEQLATMVEYVNATMGQRKIDVFLHLCKGDEAMAQNMHSKFIDQFDALVRNGEVEEFEGISALFTELRRRNVGVAITTGFPRPLLNSLLDHLDWNPRIDVSVASDEVPQGRPAPDMINQAIHLFNAKHDSELSAASVAVVGDTESDMQSGVAAGARLVVGVTTGAHSEEQLRFTGATNVLFGAVDIINLLND